MRGPKRALCAFAIAVVACSLLVYNFQTCFNVECPYGYESRNVPHTPCRFSNCDTRNPGDVLACCVADRNNHSSRSCFDVGFPWIRSFTWTMLYAACTAMMMESKNLNVRFFFYALIPLAPMILKAFGFEQHEDPFMEFKWYALLISLCCHYLICRRVIPPWPIYYLWIINIAGLNFFELQHVLNAPWVLLNVFSNLVGNFILTSHYLKYGNEGYGSVTTSDNMYWEQFHESHQLTWAWTVNYWFYVVCFMTTHDSFGWKQYGCMVGCIPLAMIYGAERFAMFRPFHLGFWMIHERFFMDFDTECTWGFNSDQFERFSDTHPYHIVWSVLISVASFASALWLLKVYYKCVN